MPRTNITLQDRAQIEHYIASKPLWIAEVCKVKGIDPITLSHSVAHAYQEKVERLLAHYDKITGRAK